MKGSRQKARDALANESSHGSQLRLILGVLRADLQSQRKLYARERSEPRRKGIAANITQIEGLIARREAELQTAIDAAAAERAMT